jgi:DNA-binding response OmpR family regulator
MKKIILIVDDERDFVELMRYRLESQGFIVVEAGNGTDALKEAWTHNPDLILLDLMLPDMTGITVAEILQRNHGTKSIPIFMLTAISSQITKIAAQAAGVREFFCKPVNHDRLRQCIEATVREEDGEIHTPGVPRRRLSL